MTEDIAAWWLGFNRRTYLGSQMFCVSASQPTHAYFKVPGQGEGVVKGDKNGDHDGMELDGPGDGPAASVEKLRYAAQLMAGWSNSSRNGPIHPEEWDHELVAEINRVFVETGAVYAMKGDKLAKGPGRSQGHSIKELAKLPAASFSSQCRRLLRLGTLQRRAAPKPSFCLKLGDGRTTNLLALILYLTGDPAREPCSTCGTSRASYFGPECVVATDPETYQHIKASCACCYYSKGGCECDHARGYKGKEPVVREPTSNHEKTPQRVHLGKRKYSQDSPMPSSVAKEPAEFAQPAGTFDEKMARYSEIYGGTDTETLLGEQRELIARMELLNRFLGVRFQQIANTQ